ncbi:hypothetical protein QEH52_17705, partial [Coraliomargarita sp. SDUM461003]
MKLTATEGIRTSQRANDEVSIMSDDEAYAKMAKQLNTDKPPNGVMSEWHGLKRFGRSERRGATCHARISPVARRLDS